MDYMSDPIQGDYFDELLGRIRDILASEKGFYQDITDNIRDLNNSHERLE